MFSLEHVDSRLYPIQIEFKFSGYPEIESFTFFSGTDFSVKLILNWTNSKLEVITMAEPSFW